MRSTDLRFDAAINPYGCSPRAWSAVPLFASAVGPTGVAGAVERQVSLGGLCAGLFLSVVSAVHDTRDFARVSDGHPPHRS
jgi:hypothetical protein